MKLHLLDRSTSKDISFSVKTNRYPYFLKIWHYHPELELVLMIRSTGTRFVGDSIEKFEKGEIILIGKNLPHMWLNDEVYFQKNSQRIAESIAIHFREDFLGKEFFGAPEIKEVSQLFERAKQGIKFLNPNKKIIDEIKKLVRLEGFDKMMLFISILYKLATHSNYKLLSNKGYVNALDTSNNKELDKVYEYIFKNFNREITLNDVAEIANMNPSAFSRFFKRVNRKTFSKYLNEIRIGYACKLLMERKYSVTHVCYESGFNNISNFNRQFKAIMQMAPTEYLNKHNKIAEINQ
ncbi:AraC family transcriptional regulator [Pseudotenacibaculum haliotis]|uniref:AraC family transcriptional regulator n=1 Tax=Pseudotenacibaculum haliotis TaxID=1862138 RepID=A0ABW5LRP6_9FLAO